MLTHLPASLWFYGRVNALVSYRLSTSGRRGVEAAPEEMRCKVITLACRIMELAAPASDAPAACRLWNSLDELNASLFVRGGTSAIC